MAFLVYDLHTSNSARANLQFIDVRVEDTVHKADARRFVGILVGEFDMNLPHAVLEWC